MTWKQKKHFFTKILFLALQLPLALAWANTGPGKPVTGGRRVLVVYNGDVGFDANIVNGFNGLQNLLTSAGAYVGTGFNFTVETVNIPETANAGMTWATATDSIASRASLSITAANYCIVMDVRFGNKNIAGGAGPPGTNFVRGDTIIQADVNSYAAYLASGGGLFIMGENYYSDGTATVDGFVSRMENMYRMINAVAATGVGPDSNGFKVGPATSTGSPAGVNPYLLETDYNVLAGTVPMVDYSGYLSTANIGSGQRWAQMTGQPTQALGIAWQGAALAPAYNTGRMAYWADASSTNNWSTGGGNMTAFMMNAIDFLFNDTCCSAPAGLCAGGPSVNDPADNPVISCFQSGANGYSFPVGTGSWTNTTDANATSGGALRNNINLCSDNTVFQRLITAADISSYTQLCFSMRHGNPGAMNFQIWNQSFGTQITNAFSIPSGAGWTEICVTFNGSAAGSTQVNWRAMTAPCAGAIDIFLDAVTMVHSCGTQPTVVDGACCSPTTPTFTPTRTHTPTATVTSSPSPTGSRTATPSATLTRTASPSPTATRTASPSATPTPTFSSTLTASNSPTLTSTPTPSNSATPTPTQSATRSATTTVTASPTFTSTRTATRSTTPTFTDSSTFTPSPSPTHSFTRTATPSETQTRTPTATPSETQSRTPTATPTATRTVTATFTDSSTITPGPSPTYTFTRTSTPSETQTRTPTATPSATRTVTPTFTDSSTITPGPSPTYTFTRTATPSETQTRTPTATPSATRTVTPTFTDSSTITPGPSPTFSSTLTVTPSETQTRTLTLTQSATPTFTPSATLTPSATQTSLDTPSYTPTATLTPSATPSATQTPSQSFSPTGTASRTDSPTSTQSPTASTTVTETVTRTNTSSRTPTPTLTLTYSFSPTATISFTVSATPIPMPFSVAISAYNAAGERVRSLYSGNASVLPGTLKLDSAVMGLGGNKLRMDFPGVLEGGQTSLDWDGSNDGGQDVSPGMYYIKMEITDPFGKVTALISAVQVMDARPSQFLAVFNSAGEKVREISLPAGLALNDFSLESDTLAAGDDPSLPPGIKVHLRSGNNLSYVSSWDGKNDAGTYAGSGVYSIVLVSRQGSDTTRVQSKSLQVLRVPGGDPALSARALSNPVMTGQNELRISYVAQSGHAARAGLYNLAGELVAQGNDALQAGMLVVPCGHLSSGIYLARFEILEGTRVAGRRTIKVALLR